jgi:hypothetical protein
MQKQSNIITWETDEYDRFNFFKFNRKVDEKRCISISESIKKHGFILPIQVVEINGVYWVIDGQHRFYAAKLINSIIKYTVLSYKEEDIPYLVSDFNSSMKAWTGKNYFDMWLSLGMNGYIECKKIIDELKITYQEFVKIIFSKYNPKKDFNGGASINNNSFKNPNYELSDNYKNRIYYVSKQMFEIINIDEGYRKLIDNYNFRGAIIHFIMNQKNGYNHERLIERLKEEIFLDKKTLKTYYGKIEELYFKRKTKVKSA